MFSIRNASIIAMAALFAGVALNSIVGAIVAAGVTMLTIYFQSYAAVLNSKRSNIQLAISLGIAALMIGDILFGDKSVALHWAATVCLGSFVGHMVVGICVFVFGKRA